MSTIETGKSSLESRLEQVLATASNRQRSFDQARMVERRQRVERLRQYDKVAQACLSEVAVPRLATLAQKLGNGSAPRIGGKCDSVMVTFSSTERFPIGADVSIALTPDLRIENIMGLWKVSIIPILIDYEQEGSVTVGMDAQVQDRFADFVDNRILRFASDYLKVHGPDSPYLRAELVTDPACGVNIPRSQARARIQHAGKDYYCCTEACRDLFARDPESYLRLMA